MIYLSKPKISGNELKYVTDCINTGWVSSAGKYVDLFEEKFSNCIDVKYAISTINGTAAIHTALKILEISKGDEIIVPTLTFVATVNPVIYVNATPVFVDSENESWNLDPKKIEEKINKKTKAIICVHLYGHPANMDPIVKIARKYDLKVIEDATEALGSKYKGINVGRFGDLACFSFNGNKIITCGGGGMIVTDNKEYAEKAKFLTTQARSSTIEYFHPEVGFNYRLTNVQAAIGLAQLELLDQYIAKKRKSAAYYSELLAEIEGITTCKEQKWAFNNYWMYSILIDKKRYGMSKDELLNIFGKNEIQARPFFIPNHTLPPYLKYKSDNIFVANKLYARGLNIPNSVGIQIEEIEKVVKIIKKKK